MAHKVFFKVSQKGQVVGREAIIETSFCAVVKGQIERGLCGAQLWGILGFVPKHIADRLDVNLTSINLYVFWREYSLQQYSQNGRRL